MQVIGTSIPRTTMLLTSDRLLASLRRTQQQLLQAQDAITTGKDVARPSQAPERTAAILLLRQQLLSRDQHDRNLQNALGLLNITDQVLGDTTDILLEAKGIASSQSNADANADSRANQAAVIDAQLQALIDMANRQFNGVSVFGGNRGAAQGGDVFVEFMGGVRYIGANEQNLTGDFGLSAPVGINANGQSAFGALSSRVKSLVDLNPQAAASVRIDEVNGAQNVAVRRGSIELTVDGTAVTVDLNGVDTLGDVVTRINDAIDGVDPTAGALALNGDGFELTANAGHTVSIADIGAGQTAADFGLVVSATAATVAGEDLNVKLTLHTQLADLGVSVDFANGLLITQGSTTKVADFSTASTVEDLVNVVEQLGLGLRFEVNEEATGLNLVSEVSGLELSVGENGGTTAEDLGLRTFGLTTKLADFRFGLGVTPQSGASDFSIDLHDGSTFAVNLDGTATVSDVIAAISAAATAAGLTVGAIGAAGTDINVGLATSGNGLAIEDGTAGGADFRVRQLGTSLAATHLGIYDNAGAGGSITGQDNVKVRSESVFTHLSNLRNALEQNDTLGITLAGGALETDLDAIARVRADVGVRAQRVERQQGRSADMKITEQSMLADLQEADLTQVITRFTQLQQQLEASLRVGSSNSQLSLLDFLR